MHDFETVRPQTGDHPMPQEKCVEIHELMIMVPVAIIGNRGEGSRFGDETAKSYHLDPCGDGPWGEEGPYIITWLRVGRGDDQEGAAAHGVERQGTIVPRCQI